MEQSSKKPNEENIFNDKNIKIKITRKKIFEIRKL